MKSILIPLAACAALTGCVGYGGVGVSSVGYSDPYYGGAGYGYSQPGYYQAQPSVYIGGTYYDSQPGHRHDARGPRGDRDRDGIANRRDRDRDGDGVRNRNDPRPNNPRR